MRYGRFVVRFRAIAYSSGRCTFFGPLHIFRAIVRFQEDHKKNERISTAYNYVICQDNCSKDTWIFV